MKKMWAIGAIALLATGCGATDASTVKASQERTPPPAAVLRVVCDEKGTRVLSSQVRARRDGIHVRFVNRTGMHGFYMRSTDTEENHGGRLRREVQKDVSSHAPGPMLVACHERNDPPDYYGDDPRFVEFEIVDPHDLWIPWSVACDEPKTLNEKRVEKADSVNDIDRWLRQRYDLPADATRIRPGYPGTQWKGNPWVLRHQEETIAYFHAFKEADAWRIGLAHICT